MQVTSTNPNSDLSEKPVTLQTATAGGRCPGSYPQKAKREPKTRSRKRDLE